MERLTLREPHPRGQDAFVVRVQFPAHREALCRLKQGSFSAERVTDGLAPAPAPGTSRSGESGAAGAVHLYKGCLCAIIEVSYHPRQ